MALPKAVQDQIARAEALHKEAYGDGTQPPPAPPAGGGDPAALPVGTPPPAAAPPQDPAQPAPTTALEPPPPGDTVSRADYEALRVQFEKLQASFNTLQGKYNAEPGRLAAENSAIRSENRALIEENARLKAGVVPPQPAAAGGEQAGGAAAVQDEFKAWFEETYGPEHMDKFNRFIDSRIQAKTGDLSNKVEQVATASVQSAKEKYWSALDSAVPGWDAIYTDPRFAAMLQEPEGRTGMPKAQFARKFEDDLNAEAVIPYLQEFQERYPDAVVAAPAAAAGAKLGKEAYVAPRSTAGGAGAAGAPNPNDNIPWVKASDIRKLAVEATTTRKWVGKEKELAALRAQYDAATRAGRVLAGQ